MMEFVGLYGFDFIVMMFNCGFVLSMFKFGLRVWCLLVVICGI